MRTSLILLFLLFEASLLCKVCPAMAQRAGENVVVSARDAFGSSVGNERVGIYDASSARGFSPIQAGNVRLEGLYFDVQSGFNNRLISGVTMRVGIAAQGYPFAAPSGIADLSLRRSDKRTKLSTVMTFGRWGGGGLEADGHFPLAGNVDLMVGAGVNRTEYGYGGGEAVVDVAMISRFTPTPDVEITPFVSYTTKTGTRGQPIYYSGGSYLPPRVAVRQEFGPSWARGTSEALNYGILANVNTAGWNFKGGLFRSTQTFEKSYGELGLNTSPQGIADRFINIEGNRKFDSWSGEGRATYNFTIGTQVLNKVHVGIRGRQQYRRYGGGLSAALGNLNISDLVSIKQPDFRVGQQTIDKVSQFNLTLGYELRWESISEITLGLQKAFYRKSVQRPSEPVLSSNSYPWLFNVNAALNISPKLSIYTGYAKGLEESPVSPLVARNRDEAPPAIITRQLDAGFRFILANKMRLVAGVFDVSKPYFSLDDSLFFGRLGEVRHRGIEFSLSGSPVSGLTSNIGTIFLDAELKNGGITNLALGKRPVGTFVRYTSIALDYKIPGVSGLSIDMSYESSSSRAANRLNTFSIPPRYILGIGGRYIFKIGKSTAALRGQIRNLTNVFGWQNSGEGFVYNSPRSITISLSADW
jgi:iron complex outermembrane recepter protein